MIQSPSPRLRLVSAIIAAVSVSLFCVSPDGPGYAFAGVATFNILCCLTPEVRS